MEKQNKTASEIPLIINAFSDYASMAYTWRMTRNPVSERLKDEKLDAFYAQLKQSNIGLRMNLDCFDDFLRRYGFAFADLSPDNENPSYYLIKLDSQRQGKREYAGINFNWHIGYSQTNGFAGVEPFEHRVSGLRNIHFFNTSMDIFANETTIKRQFNGIDITKLEDLAERLNKEQKFAGSSQMYARFLVDKLNEAKKACEGESKDEIKRKFVDFCCQEYIHSGLFYRGPLSLKNPSVQDYMKHIMAQISDSFSFLIFCPDESNYADALRNYLKYLEEKGISRDSLLKLDKETLESLLKSQVI